MAQIYTDTSVSYSRHRYSHSAWMGQHGGAILDAAWRDHAENPKDVGFDLLTREAAVSDLPEHLREDARDLYDQALERMRADAVGAP